MYGGQCICTQALQGKKIMKPRRFARTYIHTYIHTYNTNLLLRLGSKLRSNASASYLGREIESYANLIVDAQDPDSLWLHQLAVAALQSLVRRQAGRVVRFRFVHSSQPGLMGTFLLPFAAQVINWPVTKARDTWSALARPWGMWLPYVASPLAPSWPRTLLLF